MSDRPADLSFDPALPDDFLPRPGVSIGPYVLRERIGVGGMGEVYRAHDTRLRRDVAVKFIRPEFGRDRDRILRFGQEARAAAGLSHPNVCAVHDFGVRAGSPFVVMELLEGESLRRRLEHGLIPLRKAIEYTAQAARGLTEAHEKGIVHRDIKPENLFLTKDGRVKVLDFGLAKLSRPDALASGLSGAATAPFVATEAGMMLGTVGYMAPEQVQGTCVDARADLFSLGAILYELLTGVRAFRGASQVETLNAILHEEPQPLAASGQKIPFELEAIMRRCLEKNPRERFQSASDLAFALEFRMGSGLEPIPTVSRATRRRPAVRAITVLWTVVALAVGAVSGAFFMRSGAGVNTGDRQPLYRQITFRRGAVTAARFAPDGASVIFSAAWDGGPVELFEARPGIRFPQPLGLGPAHLLSVSKTGALALMPGEGSYSWMSVLRKGTLAEVSASGGAPRALYEDVASADWSMDGRLAIVHQFDSKSQLEIPPGNPVYHGTGELESVRLSPDGGRAAFLERINLPNVRGSVVITDTEGRILARTQEWRAVVGLAWSADGREVWYSSLDDDALQCAIHALSPEGRERVVQTFPGLISLHDIARDGTVILSRTITQTSIRGYGPGMNGEVELGWLDASSIADLSRDGRTLLFNETGVAGGKLYSVCLRETSGSAPVRLGGGSGQSLSPDGQRILAIHLGSPNRLMILHAGIGAVDSLRTEPIDRIQAAAWLPDGQHFVFAGSARGEPIRTYFQSVAEQTSRPITPDGVAATLASPDGHWVAGVVKRQITLFPTGDGEAQIVTDIETDDRLVQWSDDGHALYVSRGTREGAQLDRIDIATHTRSIVRAFTMSDPAGATIGMVRVTPDGRYFCYPYSRWIDQLFLVDGLK